MKWFRDNLVIEALGGDRVLEKLGFKTEYQIEREKKKEILKEERLTILKKEKEKTRICKQCNKEFDVELTERRPRLYCPKCREERLTKKEPKLKPIETRICSNAKCKKKFKSNPRERGVKQKYCRTECSASYIKRNSK